MTSRFSRLSKIGKLKQIIEQTQLKLRIINRIIDKRHMVK